VFAHSMASDHSRVGPDEGRVAVAPVRGGAVSAMAVAGDSERDQRHVRIGQLLERARDGDRSALDELVLDLTPMLWHLSRAQGLSAQGAEDVVQTTWLILLRRLDTIESPSALVGWLATVARREAWRERQQETARRPVEEEVLAAQPDLDPTPEELALLSDRERTLWDAVRRLPERCQELLRVVAFVPRPSYSQVAAALGLPAGSIGPTRGRCLAKLRDTLRADRKWTER
jgi:RNA polymerase sigma factor (sigma-70 family)